MALKLIIKKATINISFHTVFNQDTDISATQCTTQKIKKIIKMYKHGNFVLFKS